MGTQHVRCCTQNVRKCKKNGCACTQNVRKNVCLTDVGTSRKIVRKRAVSNGICTQRVGTCLQNVYSTRLRQKRVSSQKLAKDKMEWRSSIL